MPTFPPFSHLASGIGSPMNFTVITIVCPRLYFSLSLKLSLNIRGFTAMDKQTHYLLRNTSFQRLTKTEQLDLLFLEWCLYSGLIKHWEIFLCHLPLLALQRTRLVSSLGSPGPASLTGITRNSYSWPSSRPGTWALVCSAGTEPTCGTHHQYLRIIIYKHQ